MSLFRNQYRIETARHPDWDYASPGWYFVTLCTKHRVCCFGTVYNGAVVLSPVGRIVTEEWHRTPDIRPYVVLDAFVVMPNHLHGLLGIRSDTPAVQDTVDIPVVVETPRWGVSTTTNRTSRLKPHSLGAIIGQFKSVCTKRIRRAGYDDFAWQPRFYDHIIRDERSLHRVRDYILTNPARWHEDRLRP